jgi:hypothetical protein
MPGKKLRILFFREGDWWIAQCLEHDIAAQAKGGLREAEYELERVLITYVGACLTEGIEPFEGMAPAPERLQEMWNKDAEPVELTKLPNLRIDGMPEAHMLSRDAFEARVC